MIILMEKCDHTICPVLSILFYMTKPISLRLFEKFIFQLKAFYSFKITCILVRQVISLKKNGGVISKIYCLILWSPISPPLILLSASVKMAGTSGTKTYKSNDSVHPWRTPNIRVKGSHMKPFFFSF